MGGHNHLNHRTKILEEQELDLASDTAAIGHTQTNSCACDVSIKQQINGEWNRGTALGPRTGGQKQAWLNRNEAGRREAAREELREPWRRAAGKAETPTAAALLLRDENARATTARCEEQRRTRSKSEATGGAPREETNGKTTAREP
jgi:hypothetical protein